jgi:hypothetical protein
VGLSKTALSWWLGCTCLRICNMEMDRRLLTPATEEALKQFNGPKGGTGQTLGWSVCASQEAGEGKTGSHRSTNALVAA